MFEEIEFSDITGKARIYNEVGTELSSQIKALHRILNIADVFQKENDNHYSELAETLVDSYKKNYLTAPADDKKLKSFFKKHEALSFYYDLSTLFDDNFNLSDVFYKKVKYEDSGILNITDNSPLNERALASENNKGIININPQSCYVKIDEVKELINNGYSIVSLSKNDKES